MNMARSTPAIIRKCHPVLGHTQSDAAMIMVRENVDHALAALPPKEAEIPPAIRP